MTQAGALATLQRDRASAVASVARWAWRSSGGRDLRLRMCYFALAREWERLRQHSIARARDKSTPPVVLIIPPDPVHVASSKGDEAMIRCATTEIRKLAPNAMIVIATNDRGGVAQSERLGLSACQIPVNLDLTASMEAFRALSPTCVLLVGADVMDGSHDPRFSLFLLAAADLCARDGAIGATLGFSFSEKPFPPLAEAFAAASDHLTLNIRDGKSWERFTRFATNANLVADAAILLEGEQTPATEPSRKWVQAQRAGGRVVLGFNAHPLLLALNDVFSAEERQKAVAAVLRALIDEHNVSIALLAHDFRGRSSDMHWLWPIFCLLKEARPDRVWYDEAEHSAAEIKAVAAEMDGVISGRMHLSVASLSSGVPVFGLNYRGKVPGLFAHYGLDETHIADLSLFNRRMDAETALTRFIADLPALRAQIASRRDAVRDLALLNFAPLRAVLRADA